MHLSVIIPVLNEADILYTSLQHLRVCKSGKQPVSLVIVDGGSQDATKAEAYRAIENLSGEDFKIRFRESDHQGRALQMNLGARDVISDLGERPETVLYFLHVDSQPPKNFDLHIAEAVLNGHKAGCFRMRFNSKHWWLKLMSWFTRFNWKACRGGDQSLFISASLFQELGGFNDNYPVYEDYELINRLYARKMFHVIPAWLTTSARRYEEIGVFKLQWIYLNIYWRKFRGASIEELLVYYRRRCQKS